LKEKGEWDENADWVVTTESLTVEEHVDDLTGFSKYVDSSISKTINVPHDYPFEDFKKVYLDAYKKGFVKGVTTYRAGTMVSVLSSKNEKKKQYESEEIILDDVKLPDSSPATLKIFKAEGKKWYVTVLFNDEQTRPIALFVHTNSHEKNVITFDVLESVQHLELVEIVADAYCFERNNSKRLSKTAPSIKATVNRHGLHRARRSDMYILI